VPPLFVVRDPDRQEFPVFGAGSLAAGEPGGREQEIPCIQRLTDAGCL